MMLNLIWRSKRRTQSGFTLLEVLIAVGLLAVLSLAIFQTTSTSFDLNHRLSAETADATAILLSLQAVESDLSQIYSPVVGNIPPKPEMKTEEFWSAPVRSDGMRRSRFKGSAEKITFIANNNRRVEADTPQSDFQKVTWEVDRNANNTFTLYRTTDWDAFQYQEGSARKPERVALLENLSSAKFTFYSKEKKAWEEAWDSENSYTKEESRFPDLIALKIEAPDPMNNENQLAWQIEVRPNMPLNYIDEKTRAANKQKFLD